MDYAHRHRFKQLLDELDDAQFDRLVDAVRNSDLQLPGWRDRLARGVAGESKDRGRVAFSVHLVDLVRGVDLSALGGFELPGKCRAGVWVVAESGRVVLSGASDHDAFFFELSATVEIQGTVFVERADVDHLVKTLRKSLPRRDQATARVHVRSADNASALELSVAGCGNRIATHPLPTDVPELPPLPVVTRTVQSPAALRAALRVCHGIADHSYFGKPSEHLGLEEIADYLVLRAEAEGSIYAAQAVVEVHSPADAEELPDVHHSFLRRVESVLAEGPVEIGTIDVDGANTLAVRGDGWAAWTTRIKTPVERFVFAERDGHVGITVKRTELQSVATEARKIAEAGRDGRHNGVLTLSAHDGVLRVRAAPQSDVCFSPPDLQATVEPPSDILKCVRARALLTALAPLRDEWITLHVAPRNEESTPILVTTAGFTPSQNPPAATGFMSAKGPA